MTKENHDISEFKTGNFIEDSASAVLESLQTHFNGDSGWIEVDQISILRLPDGNFKGSVKGYRRNISGAFSPSVLYVEASTVLGAIRALRLECDDFEGRWFADKYPKQRQARTKRVGSDHYASDADGEGSGHRPISYPKPGYGGDGR